MKHYQVWNEQKGFWNRFFELSFSSGRSQTSDFAFPECLTNYTLHPIPCDMATSSIDIDFQSLGTRCIEICSASMSSGLVVKMSLSIGPDFSFNFCSEKNGCQPLPAELKKSEKSTRKSKSPSTRRRDLHRLAAFRNKKAVSPGEPVTVDCSLVDLPRVTATSQKESTNKVTSLDRRSPDLDPKEFICDLSVPPTASFDPDILPSDNKDKTSLCVCLSTPCVCLLAAKPLSPVPNLKILRTKDGWKSQLVSQICGNCDKPFLNSKHICDDKSEADEEDKNTPRNNMSGPDEEEFYHDNPMHPDCIAAIVQPVQQCAHQ